MPQATHTTGTLLSLVVLIAACDSGEDVTQSPPAAPPPPPPGPTIGLDARPGNSTCIAPDRATGNATLGTQRAFPNLTFEQPIFMLQAPGDASRWFVVERGGVVRVFDNDEAVADSSVFVDIDARVNSACSECGLLGMAFHPDFPATPRVYLSYTSLRFTPRAGPDSLLAEFTSPDGGLTLNPDSGRIVLTINQPETNHKGGGIAFGRDGFLYLATGDGGGANDQHGAMGNAQRLTSLIGKVIRIDIDGTTGAALYRIPPDNPFVASTALCAVNGSGPENCPEIYAWGFRNPWRWSFDRQTGDLWLGDVGQSALEEQNRVVRGGNYGWRCFEGTRNTGMACDNGNPANPLPPVAEYGRRLGVSTTGGYVYRGTAIPGLFGRYVFADFGSGRVWAIPNDTQPTTTMTGGLETGLNISSFAEGVDGELYVVNYGGTSVGGTAPGDLYRITGSGGGGSGVATQLSATGCVSAADARVPASGLIPYAPNAPFWSDGAAKERWIGLPDGQNIAVGADGDWDFPNGTVLVKNFRLDSQLIETRLFMRHPDGIWAGYTYEWNAQGTDATLVRGGKQVTIGDQTWIYPSEAQCLQCHTQAAGRSLGLETRQLAVAITYPQTGRDAHQLTTLNAINALTPPIPDPAAEIAYPNPTGMAGTLGERARSYLHTNCSQCHRPGGPTTSNMDLRYTATLASTNACDVAPAAGNLGITDARLIAPGSPDRSVLAARMNLRGVAEAMPPVGLGARVDTEGVMLISDWIGSLPDCN